MSDPSLNQPLLFISDVHLGGFSEDENARIESELIQLINYCQRNDIRMAVLGDLFDYWMEYPGSAPDLGQKLLDRFGEFNAEMGPTLFITGNHDNWTRDHLSEKGFYLEHEHHSFSLNGHRLMTLHGDGLSDSNLGLPRPALHQLLRHETFIEIYQRILPEKVGLTAMKIFSRITRKMDWKSNKEHKLNGWAEQKLASSKVDFIITGHDHIPRRKHFPFGTYINLGTFYEHRTMAIYNNDAISLVCWEPETQTLKSAL